MVSLALAQHRGAQFNQTLFIHVFDRARRARERGRPGAPSVIHRVRASRHVLVPRRVHIASRVARCRLRSRVFLTDSLRRAPCATARAARAVSRRRRRRARSCASSVSPVSRSRAPTSPGTLDLVVIFADSTFIVDRRIARLARRGASFARVTDASRRSLAVDAPERALFAATR